MTLKTQVLTALRWTAAARLAAQLITWAITLFVIRLLRDADYGLMGLAEVLIVFVTLINELGAIPALVQMKSVEGRVVRQIHGLVLLANVILAAAVFALAPWFGQFFGRQELVPVTRVLALGPLIGAFAATPTALRRRELRFRGLSILDFLAMVAAAVTSLLLAIQGAGVWALVFGSLVSVTLRTAGFLWITQTWVTPSLRFDGLGPVLGFGTKISAQRILFYIQTQVDILLVGKLLGVGAAGTYKVALNLALLPMNKAMIVLNQVALPAYARVQDDITAARTYFLRAAEAAGLVFFPLLWGLSAVAADFVGICLGPRWQAAILLLQILAPVVPLRVLAALATPMLEGLGRPGVGVRNLATTAVVVPLGILAGWSSGFGLPAICVGLVGAYLLAISINARRTLAVIETSVGQIARPLLPTVLCAALMYAGVLTARQFLLDTLDPAWRLVFGVWIGVAIFLVSIFSLNRQTIARTLQLLRG